MKSVIDCFTYCEFNATLHRKTHEAHFLIMDFSMFYFDALAKFADDKIMTKQIIIMI